MGQKKSDGTFFFSDKRKFLMRIHLYLCGEVYGTEKTQSIIFSSDTDGSDVWELMASFFCAACSSLCLHGTVRPASFFHVVVQAPHDRRSRPVLCHGCKDHKSTQKPRNLGVSTYYSCTLLESLCNVYTV